MKGQSHKVLALEGPSSVDPKLRTLWPCVEKKLVICSASGVAVGIGEGVGVGVAVELVVGVAVGVGVGLGVGDAVGVADGMAVGVKALKRPLR